MQFKVSLNGLTKYSEVSSERSSAEIFDGAGYDAYAHKPSIDDPVAVAIHELCQQLKVMNQQNNVLLGRLEQADIQVADLE